MRVIKLWKPYGVLSKFTDAEGRPTLADLVDVAGVYPIGRLDRDSEGLLLLTDDGALAHRLTDPRFAHPRTYAVQIEHVPTDEALRRLGTGVTLNDGPTRPARVRRIDDPEFAPRDPPVRHRLTVPTAWIELTLTEGRNRQVRRMTAAVGHPTLRLVRVGIGAGSSAVTLDGLRPGEWQLLAAPQLHALSDVGARTRSTSRSARHGGDGSRP